MIMFTREIYKQIDKSPNYIDNHSWSTLSTTDQIVQLQPGSKSNMHFIPSNIPDEHNIR